MVGSDVVDICRLRYRGGVTPRHASAAIAAARHGFADVATVVLAG
jgi:hypothetical protein